MGERGGGKRVSEANRREGGFVFGCVCGGGVCRDSGRQERERTKKVRQGILSTVCEGQPEKNLTPGACNPERSLIRMQGKTGHDFNFRDREVIRQDGGQDGKETGMGFNSTDTSQLHNGPGGHV